MKFDFSKLKSFTTPNGFYASPTCAESYNTRNTPVAYVAGGDWQTGTYTFTDNDRQSAVGKPFLFWNFKEGSQGSATIDPTDIATIISDFEMTMEGDPVEPVEPPLVTNKVISVVNAAGQEVMAMSSPVTSQQVTEVYTKAAVDALVAGSGGGSASASRIIRVASWNIGHLAYGESYNGGYIGDTATAKQKAWRKAVNGMAANILCCQEYEPSFGTLNNETATTADAIMGGIYGYNSIGGKLKYQCQAIFSKSTLANGQDIYLTGGSEEGTYRYQKAEVTINNVTVTIICCHFPIQGNIAWESSYNKLHMDAIIAACANLDHVIICMDSNFETTDHFDTFISAGYKLANHGDFGDIKTWPSDGVKSHYDSLESWWPTKALDNIAVKGFNVSNVQILSDGDLTDHCAIMCDLTLL